MLSRRNLLKLSLGTTAAWLLGACRREPERNAPTPTPAPVAKVPPETVTSAAATPTAAPTSTAPFTPGFSVPGTETFVLKTSTVKREYSIFVALPLSYAETAQVYPVLYTLDANGYAVMITEIARYLHEQGQIPELIVVGIGYPIQTLDQTHELRIRDYTPTFRNDAAETPGAFSSPTSGRAEAFLRIIREELKPTIHERYRADPLDAAIYGHSLGGLFALYALFRHPDTFVHYIASSPSIWWDDKVTLRYESEYAAEHDDLQAKVYMSVGGLEGPMVPNVYSLAQALQDREYANLELQTTVFDDEDHASVVPSAMTRGLRIVYSQADQT